MCGCLLMRNFSASKFCECFATVVYVAINSVCRGCLAMYVQTLFGWKPDYQSRQL